MKDFIIIIPKGALTYNEVFPLIKEKKCWTGINDPHQFIVGGKETTNMNGLTKWFGNIEWLNTFGVHKKDTLILTKSYYENPSYYPKYENYPAINVDKVEDIPYDYEGKMGVPITFMDGYHPDFDLIQIGATDLPKDLYNECVEQGFKGHYGHFFLVYKKEDGKYKIPFSRVIVKKNEYAITGILKGQYSKIDDITIGHQPILNGKDKYSRIVIEKI